MRSKTTTIHIRCTPEEKAEMLRKAKYLKVPLSKFIRGATELVRVNERINVGPFLLDTNDMKVIPGVGCNHGISE